MDGWVGGGVRWICTWVWVWGVKRVDSEGMEAGVNIEQECEWMCGGIGGGSGG